ncbi:amino acid synthesis family protein [Pseudohalocynthiibacter aestuariivivens]|uniref:Amino acid synthesis family protein n=1 Tax=Pseudohalocynthiibacter aestuariivivens TaxID=1591409 RepID=A0ABV5JA61_9RHOB|nr:MULTISPECIES: amino acid synthesis family protein [Pseudohalocynthiibacter]MCK0101983.1 amino acid synthesis family protein [Pseudohalocynthiibacter sp. F2068]
MKIFTARGEGIADPVLHIIGVAAVVRNPWAGRSYVENLSPEIQRMPPPLGKMLTNRLIALAGVVRQMRGSHF